MAKEVEQYFVRRWQLFNITSKNIKITEDITSLVLNSLLFNMCAVGQYALEVVASQVYIPHANNPKFYVSRISIELHLIHQITFLGYHHGRVRRYCGLSEFGQRHEYLQSYNKLLIHTLGVPFCQCYFYCAPDST